ncbi:acyltransferase family protein [Sphingomonas sp. Leaf62]|uniref:acyltransferase family protein n=1 Tax=Sphingomonas sp. Leaf62 TaxID=1736228 RepID=UPI0006F7EE93|nr:acyltransferase [Sphingomonas sp. Leaf62]KQN78536.1 hypothetical protein ASE91_14040 [Sphingomonas sp. Leaf62]
MTAGGLMHTTTKQRVEWIDAAKALSILMVTMLHVGQLALAADINVWRVYELNAFLAPIRMPLFFAASGVFAGSALRKSWSDLLRHKVALYLWLFVIWTIVRWLFSAFLIRNPDNPTEGTELSEIGWAILMPTTGLWFLWCLALFFVLAKVLQPFDKRVVAGVAVVVSIVSLYFANGPAGEDGGVLANLAHRNALSYFVFFYAAAMFPKSITGLGSLPIRYSIVAALLAFCSCFGMSVFAAGLIATVFRFGASIFGVALLFIIARVLDSFDRPSKLLRYLGLNTLPIYVAQVPLIALYVAIVAELGAGRLGSLANALVPLGVLIVVPVSLQVRRILIVARAGFMYRLPWANRATVTGFSKSA